MGGEADRERDLIESGDERWVGGEQDFPVHLSTERPGAQPLPSRLSAEVRAACLLVLN